MELEIIQTSLDVLCFYLFNLETTPLNPLPLCLCSYLFAVPSSFSSRPNLNYFSSPSQNPSNKNSDSLLRANSVLGSVLNASSVLNNHLLLPEAIALGNNRI
jgi:hypothetical protein